MSIISAREIEVTSESVERTRRMGAALARMLRAGDVVALVGELGAGKTEFVRGMVEGLGSDERVSSPTFVIATRYETRPALYHLDAYRLGGADELLDAGAGDFLADGESIVVVEWADLVREFFEGCAGGCVWVSIFHEGVRYRRFVFRVQNLEHVRLDQIAADDA